MTQDYRTKPSTVPGAASPGKRGLCLAGLVMCRLVTLVVIVTLKDNNISSTVYGFYYSITTISSERLSTLLSVSKA